MGHVTKAKYVGEGRLIFGSFCSLNLEGNLYVWDFDLVADYKISFTKKIQ